MEVQHEKTKIVAIILIVALTAVIFIPLVAYGNTRQVHTLDGLINFNGSDYGPRSELVAKQVAGDNISYEDYLDNGGSINDVYCCGNIAASVLLQYYAKRHVNLLGAHSLTIL